MQVLVLSPVRGNHQKIQDSVWHGIRVKASRACLSRVGVCTANAGALCELSFFCNPHRGPGYNTYATCDLSHSSNLQSHMWRTYSSRLTALPLHTAARRRLRSHVASAPPPSSPSLAAAAAGQQQLQQPITQHQPALCCPHR